VSETVAVPPAMTKRYSGQAKANRGGSAGAAGTGRLGAASGCATTGLRAAAAVVMRRALFPGRDGFPRSPHRTIMRLRPYVLGMKLRLHM
jgi:hypothetical protein